MRNPGRPGTMPAAPVRPPFRVIARRPFLGTLLLLATRPSFAMYSPEDIADARRKAAFHLEVRVRSVAPTRTQPGQAMVEGDVTRVHRGDGRIASGAAVRFWVDSRYRGQRSPPGDDVRLDLEELLPGRYLEGYFTTEARAAGAVPELGVALRQVGIFPASSATPRL